MALSGEKAEDAEAALALQKEPWPAQEAFGAQGLRHEGLSPFVHEVFPALQEGF